MKDSKGSFNLKGKKLNVPQDFRILFTTRDGSVIMNREATKSFYFLHGRVVDQEFMNYSLTRDAREHAVKILSLNVAENGIHAIVEYL